MDFSKLDLSKLAMFKQQPCELVGFKKLVEGHRKDILVDKVALALMEMHLRDVRNYDTFISRDIFNDLFVRCDYIDEELYEYFIAVSSVIVNGYVVLCNDELFTPKKNIGIGGNGIFTFLTYVDGLGITPEDAITFIERSEFTHI